MVDWVFVVIDLFVFVIFRLVKFDVMVFCMDKGYFFILVVVLMVGFDVRSKFGVGFVDVVGGFFVGLEFEFCLNVLVVVVWEGIILLVEVDEIDIGGMLF